MTDPEIVQDLRAQYRSLCIEWAEALSTPKIANRLFDEIHTLYQRLRETAEGREAILGLLAAPETAVRLNAASDCLRWAPQLGVPVLERIELEQSTHGATAKYTLKAYRAGRLNLE